MMERVLVANRGEIAVRIIRACSEMGIETVLATSSADRESLPARLADRTVVVGPAQSAASYLDPSLIVTAALKTKCDAVHPGYGFLAESPALAKACADNGLVFVGPSAETIEAMGNKVAARRIARECGVPTLAGTDRIDNAEAAIRAAAEIGFPVMLKAAAGGGGRGMKIVTDPERLADAVPAASGEAQAAFGDGTLYLERYVASARHIEVQVFGDRHGNVIHLGERDCSVQRRHQKLIEEAPAPGLPVAIRDELRSSAVGLARNVEYEGAGTVEFIYDTHRGDFAFLEMNTRIQVEHPVTEMVTGLDLVQEQLRVASGEPLSWRQEDVVLRGHALECRIIAESVEHGFRPNAGTITSWEIPTGPNVRVDTHCFPGYSVPVFYDSMLAKVIVYGSTRADAIARMQSCLRRTHIAGLATNVEFLRQILDSPGFTDPTGEAGLDTGLVQRMLTPAG